MGLPQYQVKGKAPDQYISKTFLTTMHEFKDVLANPVDDYDNQNFTVFYKEMIDIYGHIMDFASNQYDGKMGKDPNVTKAKGEAYAGKTPQLAMYPSKNNYKYELQKKQRKYRNKSAY